MKKIIAFLMAAVCCFCVTGCSLLENEINDWFNAPPDESKITPYYVAACTIPAFTTITEENFSTYFQKCTAPPPYPLAGEDCVQFFDKEGTVNPIIGDVAKPFIYGATVWCDIGYDDPLFCYQLTLHPVTHRLHSCTCEIFEMPNSEECRALFTCDDLTYKDYFYRSQKDIADAKISCEKNGQQFILEMENGANVDSYITFYLSFANKEEMEKALSQDCIAQIDPDENSVFDFHLRYGNSESPSLVSAHQRVGIYSSIEAAKAETDWNILHFVLTTEDNE